ncbi:MAG: zinc-dependent peptidase [Carboxylicivirga sp.]|jgi:Mlc titration factor MtfA (ptsG expression regulator)|nr:zinc-dependent peptidase [Carboxylicivirga sp.]
MEYIIIALIIAIVIYFIFRKPGKQQSSWKTPQKPIPAEWRTILVKEVSYYNALNDEEKKRFEFKIQEFLLNCKVTGVKTQVDVIDRVLVAASAIIPIFHFKEWKYSNIDEVLLYPNMFNERFETQGDDRAILGMVGSGVMEGKMILSKEALRHGFKNGSDKKNTAIHEFVHLIDKSDGTIDGVPSLLLDKQYTIPWIDLINQKIDEIYQEKSDINPYGGTNRAEFFSVISEYFFERPKLLKDKHPELYELLEKVFKQDMSSRSLSTSAVSIGRNSKCPCNSGKKYKACCGKV